MLKKVLIANRGEIALRIIRACRELDMSTVAVHSTADANALHVRFADEAVCIGPPEATASYLNIPAIIAAAEISGADAIHPGYGFLSENAEFAEICGQCGLTFIGPRPEDMRAWGEKVPGRALAKRLGLPLTGAPRCSTTPSTPSAQAEKIGFPVILKASGGGGGRGMKMLRDAATIRRVFPQAKREAEASFKNGDLYLETLRRRAAAHRVPGPLRRQGPRAGPWRARVLHPATPPEARRGGAERRRHRGAPRATCRPPSRAPCKDSGYVSAGTLEFLMDEKGNLYFMEMNTRIQVEHPVTEMITGIDLVAEQIRIASGEPIDFPESTMKPRGHAIECRINAEDPETFAPWPGLITEYHPPGGAGVRVDSGVFGGWRVPGNYDSLLAKIITHGRTRSEARRRMQRALAETIITGIRTNVPLHQRIVDHPDFITGKLSTRFLERL